MRPLYRGVRYSECPLLEVCTCTCRCIVHTHTKGMAQETGGGGRVCRDEVLTALEEVDVVVELGPILGEFGG